MSDGARGERFGIAICASYVLNTRVLYLALAIIFIAYWENVVWLTGEVRTLVPWLYYTGKAVARMLGFSTYDDGDTYTELVTEFATRLFWSKAWCDGTYRECARAALGV